MVIVINVDLYLLLGVSVILSIRSSGSPELNPTGEDGADKGDEGDRADSIGVSRKEPEETRGEEERVEEEGSEGKRSEEEEGAGTEKPVHLLPF